MAKIFQTTEAPKPIGPYSQAIESGGLVFFSGQIPIDPKTEKLIDGDIKAQTVRVMENIKALLKACNLEISNVVKTTVYLTTMDHFADMNSVYAKYFSDHEPARSCVAVVGLPKNCLVEIEIIASR